MNGGGDPTLAMWTALLCVGSAVWMVCARDETLRRARMLLGDGDGARDSRGLGLLRSPRAHLEQFRTRFGWQIGREVLCLPAGLALALLAGSVLPVLAGAAAVPLVGRWLRAQRRRAAVEDRAAAVGELCATLAGDLRAGLPSHAALIGAVQYAGWPDRADLVECATLLLAAARFGGDVPAALRAAAQQPGTEGLAAVAACWQVAADGGVALADGLDRIADALRAERDQRDNVRAQLAGPRSTAVMLALLPVVGLALGAGLGADPLRVLLDTPAGLGCLLAGGLLEWAGLAWTARIVHAAEKTS
jgi:tight adherence protein B